MATQSWSTRLRHDSDAVFREWGSEFASKLSAVGLVQTADTGQIDWVTVVRPGVSTDGGYEIWRMDDTEQATYPIYFKITYGTANGVSAPRIRIQVGRGSDGAGVLTGSYITTTELVLQNAATAQTADTTRQSYMCATRGFFGFFWKGGAVNGCFLFNREADASGVSSGPGYYMYWGQSLNTNITRRISANSTTAAAVSTTNSTSSPICLNPMDRTVTTVGADIQAFTGFAHFPRVKPMFGICGVINGELAPGGTFVYTPIGVTARTYLTLPAEAGPPTTTGAGGTSGGLNHAMLWE